MSRIRRNFSAKFKSNLVLEVSRAKRMSTLLPSKTTASQIFFITGRRNFWSKLLLDVLDDSRKEDLKEKLAEECKERAAYSIGMAGKY